MLENFVQVCGRLSLARVPLDQFCAGTALYRRAVADLAFARMRYPGSSAVKELERLVARTHSVVYQVRPTRSIGWWQFWFRTWPAAVRSAARPILLATGIFWLAAVVGLLAASVQPQFDLLLHQSGDGRADVEGPSLDRASHERGAPGSSAIATNNISVTLLVWALGITFGVGTVWQLILNGLMLGAIFSACMRTGLFAAPRRIRDRPRLPGTPGDLDFRRRGIPHGGTADLSRRTRDRWNCGWPRDDPCKSWWEQFQCC